MTGDGVPAGVATLHWQLTVRAASRAEDIEATLRARLLPILHSFGAASARLAACVNCAGEFTALAEWATADLVSTFEASPAYLTVLADLEPLLSAPPKRELWSLIDMKDASTLTTYQISSNESGLSIELTNVKGNQDRLVAAFDECAAGQCSCPTDEYEKVESMEVAAAPDAISIKLAAKPGTQFDAVEIGRCLDYTVEQAEP